MSFEDGTGTGGANWATKLKSAVNAVRPSREGTPQPPSPDTPQDESFVDMLDTMTDKEKAVARKKAQKLEYVSTDTARRIRGCVLIWGRCLVMRHPRTCFFLFDPPRPCR